MCDRSFDVYCPMKVYLDTCSLQRPLDNRTQLRVRLEAEAILSILDLIEAGRVGLVSSVVLDYEIDRNPNLTRREFAQEVVARAENTIELSDAIQRRAKALNLVGIAALDSLHLASAEVAGVDFFCTCDDTFLNKAKRTVQGKTRVVSPREFLEELEKWQSPRGL